MCLIHVYVNQYRYKKISAFIWHLTHYYTIAQTSCCASALTPLAHGQTSSDSWIVPPENTVWFHHGVRKQSQIQILYMYLNTNSKPEKPCIFGVFIYSWASKHPCSHAHRTKSGENKCTPTDLAIRRWILTLFLRACTQLVFSHSSKLIVFFHAALPQSRVRGDSSRPSARGSWNSKNPIRLTRKRKEKKS